MQKVKFCLVFLFINTICYLSLGFYSLSLNPIYWVIETRAVMSIVFVFSPLVTKLFLAASEFD